MKDWRWGRFLERLVAGVVLLGTYPLMTSYPQRQPMIKKIWATIRDMWQIFKMWRMIRKMYRHQFEWALQQAKWARKTSDTEYAVHLKNMQNALYRKEPISVLRSSIAQLCARPSIFWIITHPRTNYLVSKSGTKSVADVTYSAQHLIDCAMNEPYNFIDYSDKDRGEIYLTSKGSDFRGITGLIREEVIFLGPIWTSVISVIVTALITGFISHFVGL